jgi:hypothetical protein
VPPSPPTRSWTALPRTAGWTAALSPHDPRWITHPGRAGAPAAGTSHDLLSSPPRSRPSRPSRLLRCISRRHLLPRAARRAGAALDGPHNEYPGRALRLDMVIKRPSGP